MTCHCRHAKGTHINGGGLCLAKDCFCLIFRESSVTPKPRRALDFSNDYPPTDQIEAAS